jgi:hypothetical protein
MSFDPDKVRSYYQPVGWEPHEVVAKSDYDKLLNMYRESILALEIAASQTDDKCKLQTVRDWLDEARENLTATRRVIDSNAEPHKG